MGDSWTRRKTDQVQWLLWECGVQELQWDWEGQEWNEKVLKNIQVQGRFNSLHQDFIQHNLIGP